MRVISGKARGRVLSSPDNYNIRPTTDNVKESIFNILSFEIEGRTVLDLFAGTGQLGIEAISRGAEAVDFVDNNQNSIDLIKTNLSKCGFKSNVIKCDSALYLENCGQYDIIIIDPPYDSDLYDVVLKKICSFDLLKKNGIIIVESKKEKIVPSFELPYPYAVKKEYRYGKIKITSIVKE